MQYLKQSVDYLSCMKSNEILVEKQYFVIPSLIFNYDLFLIFLKGVISYATHNRHITNFIPKISHI